MSNYQSMSATFEREKNLKASAYTFGVCAILFLLFFFLQWTLPTIPPPDFGEGIEVNLGNSETGSGDIAPQVPGPPSSAEEKQATPPPVAAQPVAQPNIKTVEDPEGDAPPVEKTPAKAAEKPVIKPVAVTKKKVTETVTPPVKPVIAKPKAVFKGGTATTPGGNNADSYNNTRNQGVAGGKGDQGNPNGNPNSDSYKGNAASGNGGGGGTGGVSIRNGLSGRSIVKLPSFEDDFNENARVAVNITVDKTGNVTIATINLSGTTTTNTSIRNIAIKKALSLKLNSGSTDEQTGTLMFVFKLR